MKNVKLIALGMIAALGMSAATIAAPSYIADWENTAVVNIFSSAESTVQINSSSLLDVNQLILVQYGFENLKDMLRIKEVIVSEAIGITAKKYSLEADDNGNPELSLTFTLKSNTAYGTYPAIIVLENTQTGQTTNIGITISVQ